MSFLFGKDGVYPAWVLNAHFYSPSSNKDILIHLSCCLFSSQIFDHFVLRICDTHKSVKQSTLDVLGEIITLLEDALNLVIVPLVEGIVKNLHSKDPGVHAAAVNALQESMAHLGEADR